jgi:hypothetical protein
VEDLIHIDGSDNVHHESGLFDECLSVQSDGVSFQGKYCTVFFGLKLQEKGNDVAQSESDHSEEEEINENMSNFQKPSVGYCLPSTCSAGDLRSAVGQLVGSRVVKENNFSIVAISSEKYCYTQEKIHGRNTTFDNPTLIVL